MAKHRNRKQASGIVTSIVQLQCLLRFACKTKQWYLQSASCFSWVTLILFKRHSHKCSTITMCHVYSRFVCKTVQSLLTLEFWHSVLVWLVCRACGFLRVKTWKFPLLSKHCRRVQLQHRTRSCWKKHEWWRQSYIHAASASWQSAWRLRWWRAGCLCAQRT